MTTEDFIISLFCRVDDAMKDIPKHSQANLYPSEIVTLGILFALKGVGNRAFYRWLARDYRGLFPCLPERTRLFRLFATHQTWTDTFLVPPSLLSVIDCYGIELIHPVREGRSEAQIGKKGLSNHRWIVGAKLCFLLNHLGLVVETVLSMLTTICHFKKVMHRVWEAFEARLAFTMAAYNLLVQWHGLIPDPDGFVHLSIAEFSL